ncbi:MAG: sterol desaturase family protein, partial [Arenibacterium sp.]
MPIPVSPVFRWPPRPVQAAKWLATYWLALSSTVIELLLAVSIWWFFQPPLDAMKTLEPAWILTIWARNLALLVLVAGSLHLWLWRWRAQGMLTKFDARDLAVNNRNFNFRNQVYDNVFWSLASGVTLWTV